MAIDPSFAGRVYPPTEPYEVGREKIREFADAIGDENPISHDPAAARSLGYQDVVAPPTFAIVVTQRAAREVVSDPALGLDYSRVVHGEQRFAYDRPIVAGDRLQSRVTVESIRVVAGNDLLTTRVDVTSEEGVHVLTAYATLVARGTAG
jgi:acyl dehydratase